LKDQDLKGYICRRAVGINILIIVNAAGSPLEMQTNPCYSDIQFRKTQKFLSKVTA